MSSQCGFPELTPQDLTGLCSQQSSAVVFIKGAYDLKFDPLMKAAAESQPGVRIAWLSKGAAPRYIGHFRISGDYNIVVFYEGRPVKRLIGIPPNECLCSAVAGALSGVKDPPAPER